MDSLYLILILLVGYTAKFGKWILKLFRLFSQGFVFMIITSGCMVEGKYDVIVIGGKKFINHYFDVIYDISVSHSTLLF